MKYFVKPATLITPYVNAFVDKIILALPTDAQIAKISDNVKITHIGLLKGYSY